MKSLKAYKLASPACRLSGTTSTIIIMTILLCSVSLLSPVACSQFDSSSDGDGDDFVNEILEEERRHYGDRDDPFLRDEDVLKEKERRAQEADELRRAKSDRIRQEREQAYQKDLAKMNQEQQKKAKAQRKKDAAVVTGVLKAYQRGDLYGVLGLRYLEFQLPPRLVIFGFMKVRVPEFKLFHISEKAIKKAYRNRSRLVHPDRNRDSRAEEAFIALEECASVLLDARQRDLYDKTVKAARQKQKNEVSNAVRKTVGGIATTGRRLVGVFRRVLGPFAFPVTILGCLLV